MKNALIRPPVPKEVARRTHACASNKLPGLSVPRRAIAFNPQEPQMNRTRYAVATFVLAILPGSYLALAQQNASQHPMTFFVTSVGLRKGANLGGLAGA